MKPIIATLIFVFLLIQIVAGQNNLRHVADKYKNQENYFNAELNKQTIRLYLKEKQPNENIRKVLENIDILKVFSFSISDQSVIPSFLNNIDSGFDIKNYTPFKIRTTEFSNQRIYLKEKRNKITDLLVVSTNLSQVSVVEIQGHIDLENIALIGNALKIDGLEPLSNLNSNKQTTPKTQIYMRNGAKIMDTNNLFVLINGYQVKTDYQTSLAKISPNCISSISVDKNNGDLYTDGFLDIVLNGNTEMPFIICEGILFFGQDGYLQSVEIDDECGPVLLHNCKQKPLSDIIALKPEEIKSIELTTNPRNCEGYLEGEFIVVETK